jgi:hypothetical protein
MDIKTILQEAVAAHIKTGVPAALQKTCEDVICELSKIKRKSKPKPADESEALSLPKQSKKKIKANKA